MLHLIKLSVGSKSIEDLATWQKNPAARGADGQPRHVTRMFPKERDKLTKGGSIYWVINGLIQCRQPILSLDEVIGHDGIRRCAIVLDTPLVPVHPTPKRPFQGWRYLQPDQAPADFKGARKVGKPLPKKLMLALDEIGVI